MYVSFLARCWNQTWVKSTTACFPVACSPTINICWVQKIQGTTATFIFSGRGPLYQWNIQAKRPIISLWVQLHWELSTQMSYKCLLYSYLIKPLYLTSPFQKTTSLIKTQKFSFVFKCIQFVFFFLLRSKEYFSQVSNNLFEVFLCDNDCTYHLYGRGRTYWGFHISWK